MEELVVMEINGVPRPAPGQSKVVHCALGATVVERDGPGDEWLPCWQLSPVTPRSRFLVTRRCAGVVYPKTFYRPL
jgi:hypothetical protein